MSRFKATCLAILERVRKTHRPVLVTRFGVPVAEIQPPPAPERPAGWLGVLSGTGRIEGDIVSPASDGYAWEALRP
jgi:hypothetical protein